MDVNLSLLESEKKVDIFNYIQLMRHMRPYMVENKVWNLICLQNFDLAI